jgi:tetratricopeptide (TPR) repeat protein
VSNLLAGALSVLVATNQLVALTNLSHNTTNAALVAPNPDDPVEKQYHKLMEEDDAAQAEVDKWIQDNQAFAAEGAGVSREALNQRIFERFASVRKGYETFLQQHTNHARARIAYASFLDDIHDEDASMTQLELAREIDPSEPSVWNNLANYYGHNGPVTKAFDYYTKAIALDPNEPVYYHNFGTTVFLFRKDAKEHYQINEQQVFDKALALYHEAMKLAPDDFLLASDVAQTFYGIRPSRTDDALRAWTNAFNLARDDVEREGVHTHFARVKLHAGRFGEARLHLSNVTNVMYADLKRRLTRSLNDEETKLKGTNAPATGTNAPVTEAVKQ